MSSIILFDGECNFCNQSVQFIIQRDSKGYFLFASRQSTIGINLLKKHNITDSIDSIILIDADTAYIKSDAILNICKQLDGNWCKLSLFLWIPRFIRNFCYDIFAKNRYRWFGKNQKCILPTPEVRRRFLD
ncbi:thiol-disulfide oxidoreductase [Bacillus cereus]|nr:thiol-disulfide oxidoreductase [Bacillus cereus]PFA31977.1 thiol-disulfide oxidoreductase [Bacillus cereus]PGL31350.1 thiol-disulfide oxidoreductase [Bacillus cereus]PGM31891.1 thiol-disulfide oxidoreductase [Bacillus cereus]PGN92175.1 thiol-disulfide oxidoreductase [Bacillus cereus]